jgi:hypothetical protein
MPQMFCNIRQRYNLKIAISMLALGCSMVVCGALALLRTDGAFSGSRAARS